MTLPKPRDNIGALEGYHSPQLDVSVRLNTNESPFAPPPEFVDAWLTALRDVPLNRYPDREARQLRSGLAATMGQPESRVLCANGSNEVLQSVFLAYGGAGRKVLVFEPTYALHSHIARLTATEVVTGERTDGFTVSATEAGMIIAAERPALVMLCSPNNPTGTLESRATVEAILGAVIDHGQGLLVVDEAYGEFADRSALELIDDDVPLLVAAYVFEGVVARHALRLGFAVAPAAVIAELEKVVLPYHLSAPTQIAGTEALRFDDAMRDRVRTLVEERHRLGESLTRLPGLTVYPSGANFILVKVDGDAHALWQRLSDRGVLVRDFSTWPRLEGCLRITVGTRDEDDALLGALRESLAEEAA